MTYEYPSNMTGFLDFLKWENDILTFNGVGVVGVGLLIVLWIIFFSIASKRTDSLRAALGSCFITTIVSVLFFITGLTKLLPVLMLVIGTGAAAVFVMLKR